MAAAAQLVLAPASASAAAASAGSGTAAQRVQAPRASLKLMGQKAAVLTLASVGAGVQVKIQGGGGGTSNCTDNETNKTLTTGPGPVEETFSFDTKGSGSCAFERSYSYFKVTVTGTNTAGVEYASSIRVFFGQARTAAGSYLTECETPFDVRMSCRETSPRAVDLQAFPKSLSGLRAGTPRSAVMTLTNVGAGPEVTVRGGGAGTSNCTTNETSTSFKAGPGPIVQVLGFESKSSGSCFFEPSYSFFRISVKGRNADGAEFDSSANVFYGQETYLHEPLRVYQASCGDAKYLIRMSCSEDGFDRLNLRAEPLR